MTPSDFSRAGDLFDRLRDVGDEERDAVLGAACAENSGLRREVIRLLEADRKAEHDCFLARRGFDYLQFLTAYHLWRDGAACKSLNRMVGATGLEPVTSCV